jgi:hypothetical protein
MSVISTVIEPHRVTRVFCDCRDLAPNPADRHCILVPGATHDG